MGSREELDYSGYIEIAEGVYWVGFANEKAGFHCNPYLIVDGDEAALIDGGSRNDFGTVMLKIMRTGTDPRRITRLIYQHYDPDLCGNIPHMEALIGGRDLKILSHRENHNFIDYYSAKSPKECVEELGFRFTFTSGRRLEFIRTPYSHAAGSFVTYDTKTGVLFSSDIFGSYDTGDWGLYTRITERCRDYPACGTENACPVTHGRCQIAGLMDFHRNIMTSTKALRYALGRLEGLDASVIAPQHGSILHTPVSREIAFERLKSLTGVGIDHFLEDGR